MILSVKDAKIRLPSEFLEKILETSEEEIEKIVIDLLAKKSTEKKGSGNMQCRSEKVIIIQSADPIDLFPIVSSRSLKPGIISIESGSSIEDEGWIKVLAAKNIDSLEKNKLLAERIILLGPSELLAPMFNARKISCFSQESLVEAHTPDVCDGIMEKALEFESCFLSIDLNSLESSVKGRPGGLSPRELFYFVRRISLLKNIFVIEIRNAFDETDLPVLRRILAELSKYDFPTTSPKHF